MAEGLTYTSGPQWLAQYVLHDKWVLGVAGTHGKTTTTSMLAWILESAGLKPGFLIGGVARNFDVSARAGDSAFFVVEADEYDTAFFDKRPKFIHYAPRTIVLNNLEFDHADIFPDLNAIELQFHYLVRTIPGNGLIVSPHDEPTIDMVLRRGCWTKRQQYGIDVPEEICRKFAANGGVFWNAVLADKYGSRFVIEKYGQGVEGAIMNRVQIQWQEIGVHNVRNAMSAVAAAHHAGVDVISAGAALNSFKGVKRRLELLGGTNDVYVYDDFAHHPTAIESTLNGLREKLKSQQEQGRIIAIIEPRSNTMRMGVHQDELVQVTQVADMVIWKMPGKCGLNFNSMISASATPAYSFKEVDEILQFVEVNA
ncbi:MAG: UDP-N-acetylmuramate:L-alanyl-gamma-D-glutamyl-meso-diaminopimelate ligase, partial [Gammaproteobacteria bacterium]